MQKRKEKHKKNQWLFPKHPAFFIPLSGKWIEDSETSSAFAFFFIRKCICKTSSKFLPLLILGHRDRLQWHNFQCIWAKGSFLIQGSRQLRRSWNRPSHTLHFNNSSSLSGARCKGRCKHKNQSDRLYSSAKSFQGRKKETLERKEKKGWEGGKEQEWGPRPHGPRRLKFNGWVLVLNCDLRFGWALTVACLISHCHSHPRVYLQQGVNSASWILNYRLPTASSARTAGTLPRNQHATQGSILSSGIKINITCHISCLSSFHALSSGNEG